MQKGTAWRPNLRSGKMAFAASILPRPVTPTTRSFEISNLKFPIHSP
jgi:hypothetical protein